MQKIITRNLKNIKRYLTGGEKIIIISFGIIISGFLFSNSVSATTMDTNVNIRPSMTLSVSSNDITLNLNPATKPFDTKDLTITIGTNNPTGYKLYLTSDSTNLINTEDNTKTIETLPSSTPATGYDQASFPANYWGYRKSNGSSSSGNYLPFNSDLLVSSSTGPSNETTTSIGLASKIDYLKESGTYSLDFKLNAVPTITQYYMQDLSDPTLASSVCVTEHPTIVFDSRDEQAYMIQRLPDNRCWMLDNLNLDLTSRSVVANITTINTNADEASLKSLKEGNRSAGTRYATAGIASSWGTANSYTQAMINRGGTCDPSKNSDWQCLSPYQGASYTYNTVIGKYGSDPGQGGSGTATTTYNIGPGSYKIGTYYNYCAASAGNYCYDSSGTNVPPTTSKADYDICPKGWRMPTGGASGEYQALDNTLKAKYPSTYHTSTSPYSMQSFLSTPVSGYSISGTAWRQGVNGYFWSSNYYSATNMYTMSASGTGVNPQRNTYRDIGYSVRCILN